jgi:uncharacterized protein (TIGR02117 family)
MLPLRPFLLSVIALLLGVTLPHRAAAEPVWLISNGFHTSLGFRARDVPQLTALTPERRADYVLLGWGEADFYRYPATPWLFIKAVFWPTPGALHVVAVHGPLTRTVGNSDIIRLNVKPAGFARMRARVVDHFAFDRAGKAVSLGKGYTATSRFYLSRESFYFPKMCNMWIAQTLSVGGVRVLPSFAISAPCLQWQIGPQGHRLNTRRRPLDAF